MTSKDGFSSSNRASGSFGLKIGDRVWFLLWEMGWTQLLIHTRVLRNSVSRQGHFSLSTWSALRPS